MTTSRKGEEPFLRIYSERKGNEMEKERKKTSMPPALRRTCKTKQEGIAYQNKDITSKVLAEQLKGKAFRVYGLCLPEVKTVLPTNIPAVKANELRLDNLFELVDGSVAIVDYESRYKKEDKVKYLNYLAGIASRYLKEKRECPALRMVVLYTGDIKRKEVSAEYDIGAVKMKLEPAFLSELDSEGIFRHLKGKVERNERLDDEELMKFIILPLTYRTKAEKEKKISEAVNLAVQVQDQEQQIFVLSGILAFADKLIDGKRADQIRRMIQMTKVAMIFEKEKQQAVEKVEKEKRQALAEAQKWKKKAETEKRKAKTEKRKAETEKEKAEAEKQKAEAEKQRTARELVVRMLQKNYPPEEIAFIMPGFSLDDIEAISRETAEMRGAK